MKTAVITIEGCMQIVLTPEGDHERAVLQLLREDSSLKVHKGSFYVCEGGWQRYGYGQHEHHKQYWEKDSADTSTILVIERREPDDA